MTISLYLKAGTCDLFLNYLQLLKLFLLLKLQSACNWTYHQKPYCWVGLVAIHMDQPVYLAVKVDMSAEMEMWRERVYEVDNGVETPSAAQVRKSYKIFTRHVLEF